MKQYLALIRRADFIDLYKFGFFYLNVDKIVEFDCGVSELSCRNDIYDALFTRTNSFESSFAYLIINFIKPNDTDDKSFVSIEEVKHIFPLDFEAKREFESSFDEHVKIENPIWHDAIGLIKKKQMFQSSMQGIRNIFNIFKLDGMDKCKAIISDDMIKKMLSDVYDDIRPSGNDSLWIYLMRYERHSFYPKESVGYFMDIVHIIVNFMSNQEVEDYIVENTDIYKILASYEGQDYKSGQILDLLGKNEEASRFLDKIALFAPEIDFINVAVNYLALRDVYKEKFIYKESFIESCKKHFGEAFTLAAYMIGIALSHDKTYLCLYKSLPLAIYKSKEEMAAIELHKQQEREKAQREMERIERERELELERRKSKKKKARRGQEAYTPFVQSGGSGYSSQRKQPKDSFPPYQGDVTGYIPSSSEKQANRDFQPAEAHKQPASKEESVPGNNRKRKTTYRQDSQESEIRGTKPPTRKFIPFPITLQKYTTGGKPSTAKNSTIEVKGAKEWQEFWKEHPNETWKPKKK